MESLWHLKIRAAFATMKLQKIWFSHSPLWWKYHQLNLHQPKASWSSEIWIFFEMYGRWILIALIFRWQRLRSVKKGKSAIHLKWRSLYEIANGQLANRSFSRRLHSQPNWAKRILTPKFKAQVSPSFYQLHFKSHWMRVSDLLKRSTAMKRLQTLKKGEFTNDWFSKKQSIGHISDFSVRLNLNCWMGHTDFSIKGTVFLIKPNMIQLLVATPTDLQQNCQLWLLRAVEIDETAQNFQCFLWAKCTLAAGIGYRIFNNTAKSLFWIANNLFLMLLAMVVHLPGLPIALLGMIALLCLRL